MSSPDASTPPSFRKASRPTSTSPPPSSETLTPRPASSAKRVTPAGSTEAFFAIAITARATGCRESFSAVAARRSSSAGSTPSAGRILVTASSPVVSVPVLSITKAVVRRTTSRSATLFT